MFKIQVSRFTPFWNNSDINYPDTSFDDASIFAMESDVWDDVPNGTIEWLSSNVAWVQVDTVQYKFNYLRCYDTYAEKMYYFFVVDFFDQTTKTVKFNLELDNWATYGFQILNNLKQENPIVYFNKKHMNRYSILDNISTQDDIEINQNFVYTFQGKFGPYETKTTTNLTGVPITPNINNNGKPITFYNTPTPPIVNVKMSEFRTNEFTQKIFDIQQQFKDILNKMNIIDTGSTMTIKYNFPKWMFYSGVWIYHGKPLALKVKKFIVDYPMPSDMIITNTVPISFIPNYINDYGCSINLYNEIDTFIPNTRIQTFLQYNLESLGTILPKTNITYFQYDFPYETSAYMNNFYFNENQPYTCELVINLKGTVKNGNNIPPKTTYNVNYIEDQQFLLNTDELNNLGEFKVNVFKQNIEIDPYKIKSIKVLKTRKQPAETYTWTTTDNDYFKLTNGFYLYGVIKFPLTVKDFDGEFINYLMTDISNNLFIYVPIARTPLINKYFQNNTKAWVESSFGTNLLGIIASPISPTSLSDRAISIKCLFNEQPYTTDVFDKMTGFISPAFKSIDNAIVPKTPYPTQLYTEFTPPATESEKWDKKLSALDWTNEPLLNSPQFLEYYITNGTNNITINNYVNIAYSDQNYLTFTWGLTPISSLIYVVGLFDINRYESQKNVLAYQGTLPSNSSTYNQWILENAGSINMGLTAAKSSMDFEKKWGGVSMGFGVLDMLRGGAMMISGKKNKIDTSKLTNKYYSKNSLAALLEQNHKNSNSPRPFSAADTMQGGMEAIAKGAKSIDRANLDYKNYQRQISGMNSDAQTKTSLISSDDSVYINTFGAVAPISMIYLGLKPNDCITIWWNCYLNGYMVNRSFNFNEYDNRTFFNYLQVSDISAHILTTKYVPMEYKEWFMSKFQDGLRLWKTWLNFNVDNKESYVDRIDNVVIGVKDVKEVKEAYIDISDSVVIEVKDVKSKSKRKK